MKRMMLLGLGIAVLVALGGCGVDGPPSPPAPKAKPAVSGTVSVGIVGSS